jgi:hypothetical protein
VALKGRARFAADSYQIGSLQTDLIARMSSMVRCISAARAWICWVPQTAELYSDLRGKKVRQRMNFGNYLLFSVDDKHKIAAPKPQQ